MKRTFLILLCTIGVGRLSPTPTVHNHSTVELTREIKSLTDSLIGQRTGKSCLIHGFEYQKTAHWVAVINEAVTKIATYRPLKAAKPNLDLFAQCATEIPLLTRNILRAVSALRIVRPINNELREPTVIQAIIGPLRTTSKKALDLKNRVQERWTDLATTKELKRLVHTTLSSIHLSCQRIIKDGKQLESLINEQLKKTG
ncbi:MAG: hypothetical protein JW725_01350 [Candidatus Babeliaceae bacterium]|nr:hypothetical protein [Candidatus Babeliaceae bacterium]